MCLVLHIEINVDLLKFLLQILTIQIHVHISNFSVISQFIGIEFFLRYMYSFKGEPAEHRYGSQHGTVAMQALKDDAVPIIIILS